MGINKSKEQYKISEEQFHKIFDRITLGVALCELILDKNGYPMDYRFIMANPAFEKQTALKISSTIGKTVKEIYPDVEQSWIEKFGSVVIDQKPIQFVDYNHNTNKTYRVNAHSFSENRFAMFLDDITKRREIEENLKKSEKQYDQLFNSMAEMFQVIELIYDKDGNAIDYVYLQVNRAFEELVNRKKEELVGKRVKEVFGIIEDHWLKAYERVEKTGRPENYENYGAELDKHYEINAWKVDDGQVAIVFSDITERKKVEKILERQRLQTAGEMASSIAHDFNNALQSMMGNLEIVKLQDNLPDSTLERLKNIGSIISGVASRVNALQNFGNTQYDSTETEDIGLNTIIDECLKESRPLWKDNMEKEGLAITINTDYGDIGKIDSNRGELKTAIHNLIKNAIEAMPEGGEINIETGLKAEGIFMNFSDTGIGMDKETKLRVFQPFYTTKGFDTGRGLGMSGVYSIVKKYDGDITVKYSELGKGTTINIVFPLSEKEDINDIEEKTPNSEVSYRILWVDDDAAIRENGSEMLELLGHKCDTENSGARALNYLNENPCDILITDIGMPEMNGWQLVDAVRKKIGNKIKIIVASGWEIDDNTRSEHSVDFVLQKPFTIEEISKILSE